VVMTWVVFWPMPFRPFWMLRRSYTIDDPKSPPANTVPSTDDPHVVWDVTSAWAWTREDIHRLLPEGLFVMADPNPEIAEVWL
jgi:hypothetical protein